MKGTKERFEHLTGACLTEGYGLTEAPTCTHTNPILGANRTGDGSFGIPIQDTDARVISLEDGKTILPPGEIGELIVRGPQVSAGYHNMSEETAAAYQNGWLYTGDIVRMDEEGFFFFIDRKKELIKPGGYQVWPRDVEEVINTHPSVVEAAVGGIPDPYRGETVKAWVVLKPGKTLSVDEIRAWCKKDLAPFKVPTHVEFRDSLPKTHVGKILRRELVREHNEKEKRQ
jgi:long-chain acyl-CoA synthetase